jgi:hypothetical protein
MKAVLRLTAGGLVLADAMIHATALPEHFTKALYMGILFVFALIFLGMLGLALVHPAARSPQDVIGKLTRPAGITLMAGLIAGYVATRTVGFPGFSGGWNDMGLTSLALEAVTIVLLLADTGGKELDPAASTETTERETRVAGNVVRDSAPASRG